MQNEPFHISDQDLLLAADGELSTRRAAIVRAHLAACWTCRARMRDIDSTIAEFVRVRAELAAPLPPARAARTRLRLRMAELAGSAHPKLWQRVLELVFERRLLALACSATVIVLLATLFFHSQARIEPRRTGAIQPQIQATPDPRLTPGAFLPVTIQDVCTDRGTDAAPAVPSSLALQVFAAYGIHHPQSGAYEIDHLITPALGGAEDIRNFWPQPYGTTVWDAHIKDALEDRLRQLVCTGQLDLGTAQRDISRDWVSAYQKYFHTKQPLAEHYSFLSDRPWG